MPLVTYYTCTVCGTTSHVAHGADVPLHCAAPMKWRQTRDLKPEQHGWATGQKSAAIGFRHTDPWVVPIEGDGPDGQLAVSSLREIRKLESEAAKKAADGIGQEIRFRAFNQDTKNGGMLVNSFGEAPHHTPKLFDDKGRQKIAVTATDGETIDADELGPGAEEALMSALPESPL